MRRALLSGLLAVMLLGGGLTTAKSSVPVPVFAKGVELLSSLPQTGRAISMQFSSTTPHLYVSTLEGLKIYDISTPDQPMLVGALPMDIYENEAMSLGERPNGDKFVIMASTSRMITLEGDVDQSARFFVVVEVTNPAAPEIVSRLQTTTRTHTVSCGSKTCEYAFTDGRTQQAMSIVDLTDFRAPKMVTTYKSVVPQGHDEDLDAAGILWHVGGQGSVALDITEPGAPKPLASTNADGVGSGTAGTARTDKPWNNFIHHNSLRPNANAFANQHNESGAIVPRDPAAASVANGDVLLVTEEDVLGESCGNEGSFQTWHIPYLDRTQYAKDNPTAKAGGGKMTPLDRWTTEMLETGAPAPASYDCSAHYFDYRDGFVVQGWYGQGMRVLDVRNAKDIKQVGYWFTGATHTWAAYFVPAKWAKGRTLVYTADEFRGMDVLEVALPTTPTATTLAVRAPVLPEWRTAVAPTTSRPSEDYGWACRLPTTRRIG